MVTAVSLSFTIIGGLLSLSLFLAAGYGMLGIASFFAFIIGGIFLTNLLNKD